MLLKSIGALTPVLFFFIPRAPLLRVRIYGIK